MALKYRGFGFTYAGASQAALRSVNWSVPEGSFTVMTGATGSGKTTLLRCAKPELRPNGKAEGDALLFGCPIDAMSPEESARAIGYVSQSPDNQLVCSEVWHQMAFSLENLGMQQDEMHRRVAEVAYFFNIEPWFNSDVNSLSGGQKQLLALASALVVRPRLLLLDEPTAQLDPVAAKNFLHALFRLNRELGMTLVVATHSPEGVKDYATDEFHVPGGAPASPGGAFVAAPRSNASMSVEPKDAVRAARVSFRYERKAPWVFRDASLDVREGEVHALVGGNGCGKSTLLQLFAGVMRPEHGTLRNNLGASQAYLPQDPKALFHTDTIWDELREWKESAGYGDEDIDRMLDAFGLAQAAERAQHPYDLSGGQQQLLALAKLLLLRPRLLLLDEPSKGLDANTKTLVAQALRRAQESGATVVMATHDLSFASVLANRVSMLFDREVTCTQGTKEFFERSLFYRVSPDAFLKAWRAQEGAEGAF